ncbi:hypothetical protein [Rhodopirellula sp. SWK7]|uniref:hypothetical protein n=1 Tax=Rhodopirellula sp. SWK7 TaxID=595460 RepID=UPI001181A65D|nr:hypothetical protein [Rhodopirellula sp. SWK7]
MNIRTVLFLVSCMAVASLSGCGGDKENTIIVPDPAAEVAFENYGKSSQDAYKDRAKGSSQRPSN